MPAFLHLPDEILLLIVRAVDPEDLRALRLVSRRLGGVAQIPLAKTCFERRRVLLQQDSLETLVEISRHPVFGPAVRILVVLMDHLRPDLGPDASRSRLSGDAAHESKSVEEEARQYSLLLIDQEALMETGLGTTYLAQAMAGLPNLESVVIDATEWPRWGPIVEPRAGPQYLRLFMSPYTIEFVQKALCAVVLAVATGKPSLAELDIAIGSEHGGGISPGMLPSSTRPALQYVRKRPISLSSLWLRFAAENWTFDPVNDELEMVLDFIMLFPKLQSLYIRFEGEIDRPELMNGLSQRLRLPNLRFLGLGELQCTERELISLLRGHKDTLEEVRLQGICFGGDQGGSWRSLLRTVRDEQLVPALTIEECSTVGGWVLYGFDKASDDGTPTTTTWYAERFRIGGTGFAWADVLDHVTEDNKHYPKLDLGQVYPI
ncbi:uncharacterized protein THITE_2118924 [Thermothielavioides terrestris NRRL 8126]|uniref:F-box domain-containing protein n=1 Tax=Thermothielavioides terrestris (strain ATCC 38088 / NRRL 8126) TaxID=578455 RepID=G2RB27_THETT|nr:uncharacterized protein THITE_2118924 [Thermothielavioides terrestris NRRL 8126]AEO68998.1 hypothetical protein THITE_2118924 [Thermothielavioides terrestris NRRL 8126]